MSLEQPEPQVSSRAASPDDLEFLWRMVQLAASSGNPERYAMDELRRDPRVASYLEAWTERNAFGIVLEDQGVPVGAAWCSFAGSDAEIYGFVGAEIPVMAIALEPSYRNMHLGRGMLRELMSLARSRGHRSMSLEVNADNPRGRHLYESMGFVQVRIQPDGAAVMLANL